MSITSDFKRIIKAGGKGFIRHSLVSFASVVILTVTLFIVGATVMTIALLNFTAANIESKVDVNVYFRPSADQLKVQELARTIGELVIVRDVGYQSRADALAEFQERHSQDTLITKSLEELETNPLGDVINIRAKSTADYPKIEEYLGSAEVTKILGTANAIERINFRDNQEIIKRVGELSNTLQSVGVVIAIIFAVVSILITFNTIRLGIYISHKEIEVMRLMGAENRIIRGPFIVEGILYGIVASVLATFISYGILIWVSPNVLQFLDGFNMLQYFRDNLGEFVSVYLAVGIILGVISGVVAIRRYLKR